MSFRENEKCKQTKHNRKCEKFPPSRTDTLSLALSSRHLFIRSSLSSHPPIHTKTTTHIFFLQRKLSTASPTFKRRPPSPELHQFTPQCHDLITQTRSRRLTRHQINSESWQKKNSFFRLQNVSFSVDAHESAQYRHQLRTFIASLLTHGLDHHQALKTPYLPNLMCKK